MSDYCQRCGAAGMRTVTHVCLSGQPTAYEGCACGHKLSMCHKVNAAQWCGAPMPVEEYRAALIACAEAAGKDMSGGVPTWPSVTVWALEAVRQLRKDYDDSLATATRPTSGRLPESPGVGAQEKPT